MDLFDVIGPVMIGPSSSHTAGAVRMGNLAAKLLNERICRAEITLHGSFALTAEGHGTNRAIIGGLLGYDTDDERIVESFSYAQKENLIFKFLSADLGDVHPNTAIIKASGRNGNEITLQLSSIGGGKIILSEVDGVNVRFEGEYPTLIIFNRNVPGVVVSVGGIIAESGINIVEMRVYQSEKRENAVMIINMNKGVDSSFMDKCYSIEEINRIIYLDKLY